MGQSRLTLYVEDAAAMEALGAAVASVIAGHGLLIALAGELGTGKTTFARGLLRGLGAEGAIRSPTYTLVEPYELSGRAVYHLDLYRIAEPSELEFLGLRDLLAHGSLLLVEWPERGAPVLPAPDLSLALEHQPPGRRARLDAPGEPAAALLARLVLPKGVKTLRAPVDQDCR